MRGRQNRVFVSMIDISTQLVRDGGANAKMGPDPGLTDADAQAPVIKAHLDHHS